MNPKFDVKISSEMSVITAGICIGTKSDLYIKYNNFGIDGIIILEWIFEKQDWRRVLD